MTSAQIGNAGAPEGCYETALNELESNRPVRDIWARAFAESDGDESKAKARYINYRAEMLKAEAAAQSAQQPPSREASIEKPAEPIQQLYEAILGSKNTVYYLKKFEQFDQQEPGLNASWNWSAFVCSGLWALHRKMYGWFFALWAIVSLSTFIEKAGHHSWAVAIWLGPWIAFTVFANSLYHLHVKKEIAAAQLTAKDESELHEFLRHKGGVLRVHSLVIWVGVSILIIGIVAAIALPAYQDRQKSSAARPNPFDKFDSPSGVKPSASQFLDEPAKPMFDDLIPKKPQTDQFGGTLVEPTKPASPGGYRFEDGKPDFSSQGIPAPSTHLPPCSGSVPATWTNCVGESTAANGRKYVGEFKDGNRHGQGTLTVPGGGRYVGEWRDDKVSGQGTLTVPGGTKYVGEFKDSNFHGQGTITFPDGAKYVGGWRDGNRHGQGIEYRADGSVLLSGTWENDLFARHR